MMRLKSMRGFGVGEWVEICGGGEDSLSLEGGRGPLVTVKAFFTMYS